MTRSRKAIQAVVSGDGVVQESAERTRHILRGHYPYDPNCLECAQGRGVGRSPRRPKRERILETGDPSGLLLLGNCLKQA